MKVVVVSFGLIERRLCSKQEGGLAMKSLRHMNEALKTYWLWRFAEGENSLWRNVIIAK